MTKRDRFKLWHEGEKWDDAEGEWDRGARIAKRASPLKELKSLPSMPGITADAARFLKLKSLYYMVRFDRGFRILRKALSQPFRHLKNYAYSVCKRRAHKRDGDFFLYGFDSPEAFAEALENPSSILIVGFSYCHKPHECPSGRFTNECMRDPDHPVCRQCFIGKALNALPAERSIPLLITTVHYIGEKIFEVLETTGIEHAIFLITACELTLEMFGDFGNMTGVRGIGVRLDGRICNTMRAFELSERGVKPGLTIVAPKTQRRILQLIRHRAKAVIASANRFDAMN